MYQNTGSSIHSLKLKDTEQNSSLLCRGRSKEDVGIQFVGSMGQ